MILNIGDLLIGAEFQKLRATHERISDLLGDVYFHRIDVKMRWKAEINEELVKETMC